MIDERFHTLVKNTISTSLTNVFYIAHFKKKSSYGVRLASFSTWMGIAFGFTKVRFILDPEGIIYPIRFGKVLEYSYDELDIKKIYWKDITHISLKACLKPSNKIEFEDESRSYIYKLIDVIVIHQGEMIHEIFVESLHPHGMFLISFLKEIAEEQGASFVSLVQQTAKKYSLSELKSIFLNEASRFRNIQFGNPHWDVNYIVINKSNSILEQSRCFIALTAEGMSYDFLVIPWESITFFSSEQLDYQGLIWQRKDWFMVMHTIFGKVYLEVLAPSDWGEKDPFVEKKVAFFNNLLFGKL